MTDLFLTVTSTIGSIIQRVFRQKREPISTALKIFGAPPKEDWPNSTVFPEKLSASFERMRIRYNHKYDILKTLQDNILELN